MIRRLAHLCLVTDDLNRMKAFYSGVLGLPVKFRFENASGETFGLYFDIGDSSFIEIFDRKGMHKQWGGKEGTEPPPLADTATSRYRHFCVEVRDLPAFVKLLEDKGVKVRPIRQGMDRSFQAWINDPDGNPVELMEYTPESLELRRGVVENAVARPQ